MTELEKILNPLTEIADDEEFCSREYGAIVTYVCAKGLMGITAEEWQEIEARGYDVGYIIEYYAPEIYSTQEERVKHAKQIWEELTNVPTTEDGYRLITDADFRCWCKGTTIEELWQDIEHWFGVSVAVDLMGLE